ncbi:MAG: hypothetical protein NZ959_03950 [Armatimonadetes bacterium]|nr:hypothetical protein [Armatimonadota bacterium]MDW8122377.1 hypothetical protein [Armatimonadota bacterium]
MTPQVQVWIHKDSGENAAGLVAKLEELIKELRKEKKEIYAFVIWVDPTAKDRIAKLAQEKKIEAIALCYLPEKRRDSYLQLFKIALSDDLKNIVFVYRNKTLSAKMINVDQKDFDKVKQAIKDLFKGS